MRHGGTIKRWRKGKRSYYHENTPPPLVHFLHLRLAVREEERAEVKEFDPVPSLLKLIDAAIYEADRL